MDVSNEDVSNEDVKTAVIVPKAVPMWTYIDLPHQAQTCNFLGISNINERKGEERKEKKTPFIVKDMSLV